VRGAGQVYLGAGDRAGSSKAAEQARRKGPAIVFVTVERLLLALALDKDGEAGAILSKGRRHPAKPQCRGQRACAKGRTADSATAEKCL